MGCRPAWPTRRAFNNAPRIFNVRLRVGTSHTHNVSGLDPVRRDCLVLLRRDSRRLDFSGFALVDPLHKLFDQFDESLRDRLHKVEIFLAR